MNLSPTLKDRVLASAASVSSPRRSSQIGRALMLVAISAVIAAGIFQFLGGAAHCAGRPCLTTFELAGGWGLACALVSAVVLWRPGAALPRRPSLMLAVALVTPIALFAWMQVFAGTYVEPFSRLGLRCMGFTLTAAALPLATVLLFRRGIEPRHPTALGAAIGVICGAWASVVVATWCPLTNAMHALVGHVAPVVLLGLFGACVGRWVLGMRQGAA
jgi:hypothetical protein